MASSNPLTPPASDLSVILLNKAFGAGWQDFVQNPSGIFQTLLNVFDSALFAVLGVIATYSLIMGIAEASHDGVPLGQRYSRWAIFRIVYASAFLAPVAGGISIVQSVLLWVAGMGIGLADQTWNAGLNYLIKSGPAIVMNTETGTELAKDALSSLVCQDWVNNNYYFLSQGSQTGLATGGAGSTAPTLPGGSTSFVVINASNATFNSTPAAPFTTNNYSGAPFSSGTQQNITDIVSFDGTPASGLPPHICGSFDYTFSNSTPAASSVSAAQSSALKTMLGTLAPLAQAIVGMPTSSTSGTPAIGSPTLPDPTPLYNAINTYQQSISSAAASAASAGNNGKALASWLSNAQSGGWLTAGSFYYSFSKENQRLSELVSSKWQYTGVAVDSVADPNQNSIFSLKNAMSSVTSYEQILDQTGNFVGNPPTASAMATSAGAVSNGNSSMGKILSIVSSPVTGLLNAITTMMLQHGDPILTAQSIGNYVVDAADGILVATATAVGAGGAVSGVASGVASGLSEIPVVGGVVGGVAKMASSGLAGALQGLEYVGIPIVIAIVLPMLLFGLTLAYVLPAMPFMFWVFGLWKWILSIIEGLIGVPLWGIVHARPDGNGFIQDQAEGGYLYIFKIFLMPTVMIFGFFTSFVILDMMTGIVMDGWLVMVNSVTANSLTGIFGVIALLGIFDILMIESSRRIFKYTILSFPELVMEWGGRAMSRTPDSEAPGHDHEEGKGSGSEVVAVAAGSFAGTVAGRREAMAEEERSRKTGKTPPAPALPEGRANTLKARASARKDSD